MDANLGRTTEHLERYRQQFEGHPGVAWRDALAKYDVTQAQMARQTGASQKHINQILQGNALPSPELVVKMAAVLHAAGEPRDARHAAILLFSLQSRYLIEAALKDLKTWQPLPDQPHRGRNNTHQEGKDVRP